MVHTSRILAVACVLVVAVVGVAYAFPEYVTPYGDYCRDCTSYGSCREAIPRHEAIKAIDKYYRAKGYRIGTFIIRGRFIEADVYKDDKLVDRVVFDRKTGRLRSAY